MKTAIAHPSPEYYGTVLIFRSGRAIARLPHSRKMSDGWASHDWAQSGRSPPFFGFCSWVMYMFKVRPHHHSILANPSQKPNIHQAISRGPWLDSTYRDGGCLEYKDRTTSLSFLPTSSFRDHSTIPYLSDLFWPQWSLWKPSSLCLLLFLPLLLHRMMVVTMTWTVRIFSTWMHALAQAWPT